MLFLTACLTAQSTSTPPSGYIQKVTFKVWNNSLLPHRYTLIGYESEAPGNWTLGLFLLPGTWHTLTCQVGTKIYRADSQQVGTVMGGGTIRDNKPYITVQATDHGKSFGLNR